MRLCDFETGEGRPFFLIAGPCVIESEQLALDTAGRLKEITAGLGIPFIYKSSFDKANRSSYESYRGPGREQGLAILEKVRGEIGVPVLTDVHEDTPLDEIGLAAQKSRRLQHINHRRHFLERGVFVDISQHRHADFILHLGQDTQAFFQSKTAKALRG